MVAVGAGKCPVLALPVASISVLAVALGGCQAYFQSWMRDFGGCAGISDEWPWLWADRGRSESVNADAQSTSLASVARGLGAVTAMRGRHYLHLVDYGDGDQDQC